MITIGLDGMGRAPKGNAILWPFDEILRVEVGVEGLREDIEVDVVIMQHVEERELSDCCHSDI